MDSFCVSVLLIFAASVNLVCSHSLSKKHVALFVLGDSTFDPGNNNYINPSYQANYYPYGKTFFKHATGRFSDGRLIPDFIAEYANLPFIPPYLQPDNDEFSNGVNFASAGAGALAETNRGITIDLRTQLSQLKIVEELLRQKLGAAEAKMLLSQAVYLIGIGANDYLLSFPSMNPNAMSLSFQESFVQMVIGNLTDAIKEIYKKGGRKYGILSLGDLGNSTVPEGSALSKLHNAALSKALQELNVQLEGFTYAKLDYKATSFEILSHPEIYGHKESNTACCGSGMNRRIFNCGGRRTGYDREYELCSDPSEYFFFDALHLTDKSYMQTSQIFWNGTSNFTAPYNLKALFQA